MLIDERPAKILILGEASSVHARRWAGHFRRYGWATRWFSFPPVPDDAEAEPIAHLRLPRAVLIPAVVPRLRRLIAEFAPDVTSALFVPDYGWLAALGGAHPLVVSAWGSDVLVQPAKSRWHRRRIAYVVRRADHLIADARIIGDHLQALGAAPDRITLAPLGVTDEWLRLGRDRLIGTSGVLTVTQNRRLDPLYRVDTFVEAAAALCARVPGRFRFELIGDGAERTRLMRLAARHGCDDHVTFVPRLPESELQARLAATDIYVSTSSSDGTSVSLLEAMGAGCLPVVTDLPANREWIDPGSNGLLFPVGDHAACASQIERAATDAALRERARRDNQRLIGDRARWEDNMAQVDSVLQDVIRRHRSSPGTS